MQLRVQPSPGQPSPEQDTITTPAQQHTPAAAATAAVSSKRRLRGMPRACWSSMSGRSQSRSSSFTLLFGGALGVVFGDIGTSPITSQSAFNPNDPLPRADQYGQRVRRRVIIFWSVMIIVTLTY